MHIGNFVKGVDVNHFSTGQIVHHRRYDYRGVIIAVDHECEASDDWYIRNQTQPGREQPWYHVLVDGGRETYVAEENLEQDPSPEPIEHPLIGRFFPSFHRGRYYRQSLN